MRSVQVGHREVTLLPIKPCPFCGGKAEDSYSGEFRFVVCTKCFSRGKRFDVTRSRSNNNLVIINHSIRAWNKRVSTEESK